MKVYKGTDKAMKCRGFQYKLGEAAVFDGEPHLCRAGLHACEQPIDVLNYYAPNESRYFEADAEEVTDERESDDSKIVAKKMTLKAEIGVPGLVKAQIEYVKNQIGFEDAIKRANAEKENHATGDHGAASATGDRGAASATGYQGAASATGDRGAASATGKAGVALAAGRECKAMGALGCAICCVERGEWNGKTYPIVAVKAAIVDGENIRADTWYQLKNGKFVEVE
jgi:hypothetical protein|nr:MAG TPA: hypothetical protein [Caudoviricetes sp.]